MKELTTTSGEKIAVSEKELIWNALDNLWVDLCSKDDHFLALAPRHDGIIVSNKELQDFIEDVRRKYA